VRHIADSQRYAIETRGIRRVVELAPALPRVMGDASQLEQVVLNLVVNARQALEGMLESSPARSAPHLTMRTRADQGRVMLEVIDEGPGIPASQRERIWDPFWTTKGEGEGTGLGLSVVHGIVTAHGGTIAVESEPGEGTRFVVTLPVCDEATQQADLPPERPLDVLVLDDDADTLALASASLGERGHAVLTAGSPAQALRLAEHTAFDVVVCGLSPAAGGVEAVHQLRKQQTLRRARFVVAGDSSNGDGALALPKPFDPAALRRAVEGS
jgi:CheY-like chemotaxis protein